MATGAKNGFDSPKAGLSLENAEYLPVVIPRLLPDLPLSLNIGTGLWKIGVPLLTRDGKEPVPTLLGDSVVSLGGGVGRHAIIKFSLHPLFLYTPTAVRVAYLDASHWSIEKIFQGRVRVLNPCVTHVVS